MSSSPFIALALERLNQHFHHIAPIFPIPQSAPSLPWLIQCERPLAEALFQLHEAAWMFCVHHWHQAVVADLKRAGRPHLPYIRNTRWRGEIYLLDELFDVATVTRKAALHFAFFNLARPHELQLARLRATLHDPLATALFDVFDAMVALRTARSDLHDVPMPFTHFEAMQAFDQAKAFGEQGHTNESKRVKLAGKAYFMKTYSPDASGLSNPEQDQLYEAACAATLRAWHPHLAPAEAYHVIGATGDHFSICSAITGTCIENPQLAAAKVNCVLLQYTVLAEKITGIIDRHHKNAKIEGRRKMVTEIDLAPAFHYEFTANHFLSHEDGGSLGIITLSHARAIWETHPDATVHADGSPIFARAVIADALTHQNAMIGALQRYLPAVALVPVQREFAILRQAMRIHTGDISIHQLEQAGETLEHDP